MKTYFLILLLSLFSINQINAQDHRKKTITIKPALPHAKTYPAVNDISNYWLSEKLDGIRGYWDGARLITRQGKVINSPVWFTKNWPKTAMDGELWIARNYFQQTLSCIKKESKHKPCWRKIRFMIFDLPHNRQTFTERIVKMKTLTTETNSPYLTMIKQFKVTNPTELAIKLNTISENKGEGLMLHLGSAYYHVGRTANIMKLKKHQDSEAEVIAHLAGKGKYQGMLGAIRVKMADGVTFKIGSGFSDYERANPPPIGSIITFQYNGTTLAGIPRFARFYRIRANN